MTNLGKTALMLLLLVFPAWGEFTARISDTRISQGDQIVLTLASTVSGDLPILNEIGGNAVENSSREESTSIINGRMTGMFKVNYVFTPMKSFTVPSYEMKENGKTVRTKPIPVSVKPYAFDKDNSDLVLKVTTSRKSVIVGEPFIVTLTYKQKLDMDVVDRRLTPPSGKHLWVDKNPIQSISKNANYEMIRLDYVFTAQKAGQLVINPANIKVGERSFRRDAWGIPRAIPRYKTVFSDDIIISAVALPAGVENVGDFKMSVEVDKTESNEKEAVNLTIRIEGEGNVADIKPFDLKLDKVLVYDEEPQHKNELVDGHYKGSFIQKFALVADANYTIPSFAFSFYNPKNKAVKHLASKAIPVKIKRTQTAKRVENLNIEKAAASTALSGALVTTSRSWIELIAIFVVGWFAGFMMRSFPTWRRNLTAHKKLTMKTEKELMQLLMPYVHTNEKAKAYVEELSEIIYQKSADKVDKKAIRKLIKELSGKP